MYDMGGKRQFCFGSVIRFLVCVHAKGSFHPFE